MDLALAALLNGLPGIGAEDLDTMLKDLPLPQAGETGGISVQEAVEVSAKCYMTCYIVCYITQHVSPALDLDVALWERKAKKGYCG